LTSTKNKGHDPPVGNYIIKHSCYTRHGTTNLLTLIKTGGRRAGMGSHTLTHTCRNTLTVLICKTSV